MIKLVKKTNGSSLYLGVMGTEKERRDFLNSIFNWGAWASSDYKYQLDIDTELTELAETVGEGLNLIHVKIERLIKYFVQIESLRFDPERIETSFFHNYLNRKALQRFENIEERNFFSYKKTVNANFHSIGVDEGLTHFAGQI